MDGSAAVSGESRLSAEDAIPYLTDVGLMSRRNLMRGDVRVEDVSRRNRNLKVISTRGPSFVLKQPDPTDRSTVEGIRREARVYEAFGHTTNATLRRLLPRFCYYDAKRTLLVLELIPSAAPLGQFLDARGGRPQPAVASAAGYAIAAFQRFPQAQRALSHKAQPPWALRFSFPGPELLCIASLGQLEVVRIIQKNSDAWNILGSVRNDYRGDCLVHGDLRWDNVLMRRRAGRQSLRLWVIDWELADVGDPAWDVASLFAAFLARCVCFMEPGNEINPHSLRNAFACQLPAAHTEIRSAWMAYLASAVEARTAPDAFLHRAAMFCGARLLQMAFEWSPGQAISPIAACFLQLGLNLLRRPRVASRVVFGISPMDG